MTSQASAADRQHLPFPRRMISEHLQLTLVAWAGLTAFVTVLIVAVAAWRGIEVSGWHQATQVVRWFSLVIGAHLGYSLLPLYVAYGQTRRNFMGQALIFLPVFAAVVAGLVALNYLIEAGLYGLAGWPQAIDDGQLYASAVEPQLVILHWLLVVGLWASGGFLVASAWYRNEGYGVLALLAAILIAGVASLAFGDQWGPIDSIYQALAGAEPLQPILGIAAQLAATGLLLLLAWLNIRDIPLRSAKS